LTGRSGDPPAGEAVAAPAAIARRLPRGLVTRYAPAPTGWLHLGHVVNAIWVWGLSRATGGRVLLRIEDHDRTRCRREFDAGLRDDLAWLGFAPDGEPVRQSDREALYERALARLSAAGLVYPCDCTRRAIAAVAEPGAGELRYPGTCRERDVDPAATPIRRVRLDRETIAFDDLRLGSQRQIPAEQCGDLVARDRDGCWSYQFAVAVDDLDQGVGLVIRGEDLLASTGRQIQLARLLGRERPPRFLHHGLLRRPDGEKLSKARRDEGVRELRAAGWTPERVVGVAAHAAGLQPEARPLAAADVARLFED
jgi:glutamyl-Q tRNA(Asp) synthetase